MKKLIAMILSLTMVLALASCGGGKNEPAPAESPDASQPAVSQPAEAPAEKPDKVYSFNFST